jgi:Ca2+-binding EF-hand superfamily protein
MKLDVHQQREKELKLGDSKAFKMRRDRVQKRHDVKRNRRVKHLAKKLGFEERHLKALQEEFNSMDEDHSGEIDLDEFQRLATVLAAKGGTYRRFAKLRRAELREILNKYDHDQSGTIQFEEFLHIVSPRREKFFAQENNRRNLRKENNKRRHQNTVAARQRYAWNLYHRYNGQLAAFGRKWGYDEADLKKHKRVFDEVDDDGSGEIDLDELMKISTSLGLSGNRDEIREHMKVFDYKRCGRIDFMGFLEMMSTRRKHALERQKEKLERIHEATRKDHTKLLDVRRRKRVKREKEEDGALRKWARKLGYSMKEIKMLKERFNDQDGDKSGEIDLEELRDMLTDMAANSKEKRYRQYLNLSRDEAKVIMDYYDRDGNATLDFPEFLDLCSPRRAKAEDSKIHKRAMIKYNRDRRAVMTHNARHRAAWGMYNKHIDHIVSQGRRLGYTEEDVESLYAQFNSFDGDGSGDIDLKELTVIVHEHMGRSDLSRDDLREMMKEFDHLRNGSIQFLGFLEMMSPRRQRMRERYMNAWEETQTRARVTAGLEGTRTRLRKYTGGVKVPRLNLSSTRDRDEDHEELNPFKMNLRQKKHAADSYIRKNRYTTPQSPPAFPEPPGSPVRSPRLPTLSQSTAPLGNSSRSRGIPQSPLVSSRRLKTCR